MMLKNKGDITYWDVMVYLSNYMAVNVGQFTPNWKWDLREQWCGFTQGLDNTSDGACKQWGSLRKWEHEGTTKISIRKRQFQVLDTKSEKKAGKYWHSQEQAKYGMMIRHTTITWAPKNRKLWIVVFSLVLKRQRSYGKKGLFNIKLRRILFSVKNASPCLFLCRQRYLVLWSSWYMGWSYVVISLSQPHTESQ